MRKVLLIGALVTATLAPFGTARAESLIDCGPGDGRESMTTQGFEFTFLPPSTGGNSAASSADTTGTVWANRTATFPFRANFAPSATATLKLTLAWANNPHDYDLYFVDAEGNVTGSENFNQTDPTGEALTMEGVKHCDNFAILVRNWVAGPAEQLTLKVVVEPTGDTLACADGDTAPGCAGKAAGEAPSFVPDDRARLYFGGDRPGMVAATARYAFTTGGQQPPIRQALVATRPNTGAPNFHTRPVAGNPDFGEGNNFFPYFRTEVAKPVTISGPVHVLAWLSSRTMDADDKLFFDLYLDGGLIKRVEVTPALGPGPKPVLVTIDGYEPTEVTTSVTVGISSPRGNDDPPNQASYAEWTLLYDSVQYQSRATLPVALPS